jgi:hypothetical protein
MYTCFQILCIDNIQCVLNVTCKAPILTPCIFVGMCSWIGVVFAPCPATHRTMESQMLERQSPVEIILTTSKLAKGRTPCQTHISDVVRLYVLSEISVSHFLSEVSNIDLSRCTCVCVCMGLSLCVCLNVSATRSHHIPQCRTLYMCEQLGE